MKQINYESIAKEIIKRIDEESDKGMYAHIGRINVLCAMLDYLLLQQYIAVTVEGRRSPAWELLADIFPEYTCEKAFGLLCGDLLDFMVFDDTMARII